MIFLQLLQLGVVIEELGLADRISEYLVIGHHEASIIVPRLRFFSPKLWLLLMVERRGEMNRLKTWGNGPENMQTFSHKPQLR